MILTATSKKRAVKKMLKSAVKRGIDQVFKEIEGNDPSVCEECINTFFEVRRQLSHDIVCLIKKHGMGILDYAKYVAKTAEKN
jgi:hypothetical protein